MSDSKLIEGSAITERSKKLMSDSKLMQEIHEKAQEEGVGCLHVTEIGKRTGLHYQADGNIRIVGGYFPKNMVEGGIRECLVRWRWIDDDIDEVKRELRAIRERFNEPANAEYGERSRGKEGGLPEGMEKLLIEREKTEALYVEELAYLLEIRRRINEFVSIVDEVDRQILTLRFLKGYDWSLVAEKMKRNYTKMCFDINRVLERWDKEHVYEKRLRYSKRK